jgi:hypothetical protein
MRSTEPRDPRGREVVDRERAVNDPTARELHTYGLTCYWLLLSEIEVQALTDGVLPTQVRIKACRLLEPGIEEGR